MGNKKITVIGSTNTDMVIKGQKLPAPGETILGGAFFMNPGGKGANQAVAAARLGGNVTFITKIGNDIFGDQSLKNLKNEDIDTKYVLTDNINPSGVALITIDENGENCIVVAPGANSNLLKTDVELAKSTINNSEIILLQLEIPIETIEYSAQLAFDLGKKVILNPAPAQRLSDSLLKNLYIISPNETEAEILTGIKITNKATIEKAAKILKSKGVEIVIITLGAEGAYVLSDSYNEIVPSVKVKAIDTTAAGDTFNGALASALCKGSELIDAIQFANKAAAISVTRMGAQASIPQLNEII
jgi:ribokinase